MAEDRDRKTEHPTAKRLRKAREKGSVAKSVDVNHAFTMGAFLVWSSFGGAAVVATLSNLMRHALSTAGAIHSDGELIDSLLGAMSDGLRLMLPIVFSICLAALVASWLQVKFKLKKPLFEFDLKRINPASGIRRLFSMQKTIQALKALLKMIVYAGIAAMIVLPEWHAMLQLGGGTIAELFQGACGIAWRVLVRALLVNIAIAVPDYALAKHFFIRDLKMTKQEIKDEHKENEGNPQVKSRLRQRQRDAVRRRMMQAVSTASVVVTNPTHVAVALKYDGTKMVAPIVVAKGRGFIALKIKELAALHRVPILEDPPLARTLEKLCPIGFAIPPALYRAVAEVFAYVLGRRRDTYRYHHEVEALSRRNLRGRG